MDTLNEMSRFFIVIIRAGAVMRIIYCFIRMASAEEEQAMFKKRIRNVLVFYCIAELVWVIKNLILSIF